jgi:ligand-binding sensor domain-containing protein/DNA-binding NarL/FixJ family response regulator
MKTKGFLGVVLTLALIIQAVVAAESLPGRYFRFERITPEFEGRAVIDVSSLLQDREGFLWVGTGAGLARYDGYHFVFYSPERSPEALATLSTAATTTTPAAQTVASSLVVYPILEDGAGDIWIGTHGEGLFRFDKARKSFVQYRLEPHGTHGRAGDIVLAIEEDSKGGLWVGTRLNGLARLDRKTGTLARFPLDPKADTVWSLLFDRRGFLWVGTQDEGLFRVQPETGETVNYRFIMDNPRSLGSNTVWSLFEDREGTVWIGTYGGGLNAYDPSEDRFVRFYGDATRPHELAGRTITAIAEDGEGRLWIGTSRSGLRVWDRKKGDYVAYRHDPQEPDSISGDSISALRRDASGIMWIGTVRGGLDKCLADEAKFPHFKPNPGNPGSLSQSDVRSLMLDRSGTLWVGFDKGFDRVDGRRATVTRFAGSALESGGRTPSAIQAIHQDRAGRIWIGTENGGLLRFDPGTGIFDHYLHDPGRPAGLSNNKVYVICEDHGDPAVLWVATHNGLDRFDTRRNLWRRLRRDPSDPTSLSGSIIRALLEDKHGNFWVGTSAGLNRLDKATGRCIRYAHDIRQPVGAGLVNNVICCLHEDAAGALWIGTEAGLNRFIPERNEWLSFTPKEGLPGSIVCGILEDEKGALWISTNRGLSKFDPGALSFTNFGMRDGLQGLVFNPGASFKAPDGRMFFGGVNGFNVVDPSAVKKNPFVPPVVLTGLSRHGRTIKLDEAFVSSTGLKVSYKFGFMTLDFAALGYIDPAGNRFAYRLEPRDGDWIGLGYEHSVSLSDLDSGNYVLRVKAANPDGVWNEEALTIPIEVIPPFWKTPWFLGAVVLFLLSGVMILAREWRRLKSSTAFTPENIDTVVSQYRLTPREEEILRLVLEGARNKDIEKKLFISASTVRNHIYNIYQKLGVKSRLELIHRVGKKPS